MNKPTAPPPEENISPPQRLKTLRLKGSVFAWAAVGVVVSIFGLLLLTGLSSSPWLFLLYLVFIPLLLVSLSTLALHLLHHL